jgi:serine protease Do
MINRRLKQAARQSLLGLVAVVIGLGGSLARAQSFDYELLEKESAEYTVIVELEVEISFGAHTTEQKDRYLGTIVTGDGLVVFDGADLLSDNALSAYSGFAVKTVPIGVEISGLDGTSYIAEYVGVDRYSRLAFARILIEDNEELPAIRLVETYDFKVGQWLTLYMLLPDFIQPSVAADVGMISTLIESPEQFPLTIGFGPLQLASVLFNEQSEAVGLLGMLVDPAEGADFNAETYAQYGMPMLGVITADRINKLIAEPPTKGEIERGWLGIRLQALTSDMAEYWNLEIEGGIIINEIIKNSPAETAQLQVGDIIFELNGELVEVDREENLSIFQRRISEMSPGEAIELSVLRPKGDELETHKAVVTLIRAPLEATDSPEYESESLEFTVRDLVFDDFMFFQRDPDEFRGVFVSGMEQGGLANVGGLKYGDVIQRIGMDEIAAVTDVEAVIERLEQERPSEVIFFVWRSSRTMFVNVKTDWE